MFDKYHIRKRNNSRLIVIDDRLSRTFWRRLKGWGSIRPQIGPSYFFRRIALETI
jgi:hypothetical protein